MDKELCQLGILGLTPTPGVPCTATPAGDDWYTVVNNTDTAWAPWNLSTPLDVKWTRILLKANNSTPVAANGDSGVGTQTCWEGNHQILKPAGFGPDCGPDGSVIRVEVTSGGTGYTSKPDRHIFCAPDRRGRRLRELRKSHRFRQVRFPQSTVSQCRGGLCDRAYGEFRSG
jgi:hypothetical protein